MKKLFAILLTLAMILAMSATVFADEVQTYTLTINGAIGHTYALYQIYTGDVDQEADGTTVISNLKFGQNHVTFGYAIGDKVPGTEITDFLNAANAPEKVKSMITDQTPYRTNLTPATGKNFVEVTDLPGGYYMVVDISTNLPVGETTSPIILQMVEDVTVTSKHASIVSEKKVADTNDSYGATLSDWADSADYDMGDDVHFQLSVTLPKTFNVYETYHVTFHDQQSAAFGTAENFVVYILKADGFTKIPVNASADGVTAGYVIHEECPTKDTTCEFGGCSFAVEVLGIEDLYPTNDGYTEGDKVVVEYTAELKDNANIGAAGNENGMYVCHPDGHTAKDYVTVLTYQLKVNKVDGADNSPLAGADFKLYKWFDGAWNEVERKTANDTDFTWYGIDDGKYRLEETETPDLYNSIAPMEFEITADHKVTWVSGGNTAFEDLIAKDAADEVVFADQDANQQEDGMLEGNVANYKGAVLPETGAMGTFLFIGIGTLLAMTAVVVMVTRKKMSIYED